MKAADGPGAQRLTDNALALIRARLNYLLASVQRDRKAAAEYARAMAALPDYYGTREEGNEFAAEENTRNHRFGNTLQFVEQSDLLASQRIAADVTGRRSFFSYVSTTNMWRAAERSDWARVVHEGESLKQAMVGTALDGLQREMVAPRVNPLLAEGCARTGRGVEADALLAEIPNDAVDGWRARGRIASLRGDYGAADAAFREAAQRAPDAPAVYMDWANMLAAKGDRIMPTP